MAGRYNRRMHASSRSRLRLRPALVILLLAGIASAWVWLAPATSRQNQVMTTMAIGAVTLLLLIIWLVAASGLRWWQRLAALTLVAGIAAFLALSLEPRGFSGDVVPRFGFKWSPRPDEQLATDLPRRAGGGPAAPSVDRDAFPHFLGPSRNATVTGLTLADDWEAQPPQRLWRRPVGAGNSGFVVAAGVAVTQEQRGEQEMVVAYDLASGEPLWGASAATRHSHPLSGDGPCATPSIVDGVVYAQGATGMLSAHDLGSGALRWRTDVLADADAEKPLYGLCASPLVDGDLVIVVAGGPRGHGLAAYDRHDGTLRWSGGDYRAAYSSPMVATLAGVRQIVVFHQTAPSGDVTAHGFDGQPLWHTAFPSGERTSQPVALPGDRVLVSGGYGAGAKVLAVRRDGTGWVAEEIWAAPHHEGQADPDRAPRRHPLRPRRRHSRRRRRGHRRARLETRPLRPRADPAGRRAAPGAHREGRGRPGRRHPRRLPRTRPLPGHRRPHLEHPGPGRLAAPGTQRPGGRVLPSPHDHFVHLTDIEDRTMRPLSARRAEPSSGIIDSRSDSPAGIIARGDHKTWLDETERSEIEVLEDRLAQAEGDEAERIEEEIEAVRKRFARERATMWHWLC